MADATYRHGTGQVIGARELLAPIVDSVLLEQTEPSLTKGSLVALMSGRRERIAKASGRISITDFGTLVRDTTKTGDGVRQIMQEDAPQMGQASSLSYDVELAQIGMEKPLSAADPIVRQLRAIGGPEAEVELENQSVGHSTLRCLELLEAKLLEALDALAPDASDVDASGDQWDVPGTADVLAHFDDAQSRLEASGTHRTSPNAMFGSAEAYRYLLRNTGLVDLYGGRSGLGRLGVDEFAEMMRTQFGIEHLFSFKPHYYDAYHDGTNDAYWGYYDPTGYSSVLWAWDYLDEQDYTPVALEMVDVEGLALRQWRADAGGIEHHYVQMYADLVLPTEGIVRFSQIY